MVDEAKESSLISTDSENESHDLEDNSAEEPDSHLSRDVSQKSFSQQVSFSSPDLSPLQLSESEGS